MKVINMTPNTDTLRLLVKRLRKERSWTQDELADYAGVARQTVHRLESGKMKRIDVEILAKIAIALDTTASKLMEESGL